MKTPQSGETPNTTCYASWPVLAPRNNEKSNTPLNSIFTTRGDSLIAYLHEVGYLYSNFIGTDAPIFRDYCQL